MSAAFGEIGPPADEGQILVTCFNNDAATKKMQVNAQRTVPTMYKSGSKSQIHALIPEDFVYQLIDQPSNSRGLGPAVSSSLNGYGVLEKEAFPNDEAMQVEALKSKIRPIGYVPTGMKADETSSGAISIAVAGKCRHKNAICDMHFGAAYKLRPATPSEVENQQIKEAGFTGDLANDRARIVAEPVVPRSMFDTACNTMCHLNHYYNNKASYLKGMERGRENTDMASAFCLNMGNFATTCGIHFLHQMMQAGFIAPALYYRDGNKVQGSDRKFPKSIALIARKKDRQADDVIGSVITMAMRAAVKKMLESSGRTPAEKERIITETIGAAMPEVLQELPTVLREVDPSSNADDFVRKLATCMGLVNAFNSPEVAGMGVIADEMKKRQLAFLNTVFASGEYANYEFGTTKDGSSSAKESSGKISNNVDGMVLSNQYNAWRKAISSMTDMYNHEMNWRGGIITVPGNKGEMWEGLHGY